jgi:hypothetical protein
MAVARIVSFVAMIGAADAGANMVCARLAGIEQRQTIPGRM